MTTAQATGRLLIAFVVLGVAILIWVVALGMARTRPRWVRVSTLLAGLADLALASWLAVMVWMAPA